jgi:CHAT domain-containing protein
MTAVFQRYAADPNIPRAEALRQGMLRLMRDAQGGTAYFAHPYAWAPFVLVGDGAAGEGDTRPVDGGRQP